MEVEWHWLVPPPPSNRHCTVTSHWPIIASRGEWCPQSGNVFYTLGLYFSDVHPLPSTGKCCIFFKVSNLMTIFQILYRWILRISVINESEMMWGICQEEMRHYHSQSGYPLCGPIFKPATDTVGLGLHPKIPFGKSWLRIWTRTQEIMIIRWRMPSSGMLRRVALVRTDVSEEHSASIIRVTSIGKLGTTLAACSNRSTQRRNSM
jgi:hypothetical protein